MSVSHHPPSPSPTRPAPFSRRVRRAAAWTAAAVPVLVVPGLLAPDPPAAFAVANAAVHVAVFAGLVTLWARAVPRLRAVVLVAAVVAAVLVEAAQAEAAFGWAAQTRALWADVLGIGLGWAVDRAYRRRPLPGPLSAGPRLDPGAPDPGASPGSAARPDGVSPRRAARSGARRPGPAPYETDRP